MLQPDNAVDIQTSHPEQPSTRYANPRRTAAALLAAASLLIAPLAQAAFFTPGQLDVSPTGAASYTVPISAPPGTAGMVPSLALACNSQGGNGLLGVGWSLSGLSAVTRCPKTLIQDGTKSGINYDATDKYCLDGQRLISISGTYGANNTEYRTEREGFSKIVSYVSNGYGPTWFKVWTKSGQIIEFGNTADSAVEAQGKTAIRVWAVNRISDTKGNYLTVTYTEDNPNGQYYPNRIDYTGNANAGLAPYNSVRFTYAARPDVIPATYVSGSLTSITQRLTNVQAYAKASGADTLVKDYRLAYDNTGANGYSLLSTLTECDGSATPVCLQPTTLTWQKATGGDTYGTAQMIGAGWYGDVNGDGTVDRVYTDTPPYGDSSPVYTGIVYVALGGGSNTAWGSYTVTCTYNSRLDGYICPSLQGMLGDLNGDGKQDLVTTNDTGGAKVRLSGGTSFNAAVNWGATPKWVGDVNGDGKDDFVWLPTTTVMDCGGPTTQQPAYVGISTGTGLAATATWGTFTAACTWNGSSETYRYYPAKMFGALGDVNGDGRKDLVFTTGATGLVGYSTGSTFTMSGATVPTWNTAYPPVWVSDVNGDGMADFVSAPTGTCDPDNQPETVTVSAAMSNGNGFVTATSLTSYNEYGYIGVTYCKFPNLQFADINNDGKDDMIVTPTQARMTLFYAPDVAGMITNGLGAATVLTYKALSDAATYTPESGSAFPVRGIGSQVGLYVVSTVSSNNGIGGNYTSNYTYAGAKSHLTGGGFLGYRQTTSTDAQTGIKSTTTYRQDYPYQGLPLTAEKRTSSNVLLNSVSNTWAFATNPAWSAQYHVPQLTGSVESSYELTGTIISTVTTGNTYDAYGNPTIITVSTPDGYSKTTTNSYTNDLVNWYLGRLISATVTSTAP